MPIKFDAEDRLLSDILNGKEKYRIPRYQRPYSWTTDEVADLWNDLVEEESTFLGSFVFNYENYNEEGLVEVIDGQQRLITLTILIAVLRDVYKELGETRKQIATQGIIAHTDPISLKEDYRLKCGDALNKFFNENIQKEDSDILLAKTTKIPEEKKIKENYKFLKDKVDDELRLISEKIKKIQYVDSLKQRIFDFKIIWIKIENDEDAYSIFETVNARGADLTAADLLKNYLFGKLPKKEDGIDTAQEKWSIVENNINNAKGLLNISKFIRYFWLSKYSFVSEKRLYKEVKRNVSDPNLFLDDLVNASEYYYKIASDSVSINDWMQVFDDKRMAQKIMEALNGLRVIGITQCYSLLFCLLLNKDKIEFDFSDIFKTIEKYHFAYSAICKLSGNVVEKIYSKTSNEIQEALKITDSKKRNKNLQRVLSEFKNKLKSKYPDKEFFIKKFQDVEYKNYPVVIYVLTSIERAKENVAESERVFTKSNIEHILPQEPVEWGLDKKDVQDYVNKLGNLTLISKEINGRMGNKTLEEKIGLFKDTKLDINRELLEKFELLKNKWNEEEIIKRQAELAEFAYDVVWKFK